MRDVASLARVSVATVSHVLNRSKVLSPAVTDRVLDAARTLHYRLDRTARALRTGKSQVVGLLFPDLANPFFPELARAIERAARDLGYSLILVDTSGDAATEQLGFELLSEHKAAGAIWIPASDGEPPPHDYPIVVVDRPVEGFDCVCSDHLEGGRLIARHLIALGHKRIGLLSGPAHLSSARLRRRGFLEAIGGEERMVWEHEVPFASPLPDAAAELLRDCEATVIVAANDVVAVGVLEVWKRMGRNPSEEPSVVGYDDLPWSAWISPALTTVRQNITALGERAVVMWHNRLHHPTRRRQAEKLPVELVVRASTKPLRV